MRHRDRITSGKSNTSGFATIDDKKKRFEPLSYKYLRLLQDSGRRLEKANLAILEYGNFFNKTPPYDNFLSYCNNDRVYNNCDIFIKKFEEIDKLLSNLSNLAEEIKTLTDESTKSSENFTKAEFLLTNDDLFKQYEINNSDAKKILVDFIASEDEFIEILSRLRSKGLTDLREDTHEIDGKDLAKRIFKLLEYCETRQKRYLIIQSISDHIDIPVEKILEDLMPGLIENRDDKFGE